MTSVAPSDEGRELRIWRGTAVVRLGARRAVRGLTLIEILIVLAIVAIVTVGVVGGSGQLEGARLKQGASLVSGAIRAGYARANARSKSVRLVFDFEKNSMWLEEADRRMLVQSGDKSGTGGADPTTEAEKAALAESERIVKGPATPRPAFRAVTTGDIGDTTERKTGRDLPRGITFREVQAAHDTEPKQTGRAYLYFWPGGMTERAVVQLAPKPAREGERSFSDDRTLSVLVSPLTGKTTLKAGAAVLKVPKDEGEASEREDRSL